MAKSKKSKLVRMSPAIGRSIAATCYLGVMALVLGLGLGVGMFLLGPVAMMAAGAMVWSTIYFVWGFRIVPTMEFRVVERLGQYYYVCNSTDSNSAWIVLCLPGIIDRIAPDGGAGNYKYKMIRLYEGALGSKDLIDFTDGSAATKAEILYRINPDDPDSAAKWTYIAEKTEDRLREVIDAAARPKLQKLSIDEAQKNLEEVSTEVEEDDGVLKFLKSVGANFQPNKGFLITDIELPPEVIATRQETLKGKKEAERQAEQGAGYVNAILKIIELAKIAHIDLTWDQAKELYETQRGLETIGATGSNISFVSSNLKGVLVNVGVK